MNSSATTKSKSITRSFLILATIFLTLQLSACHDDQPDVRSEKDIVGCWTDMEDHYMYLDPTNMAYNVFTDPQDPELSELVYDAYYYEPGYNFLLYIDIETNPDIYVVTQLNDEEMTWVWADNLRDDKYEGLSKSEILGMVIKQAQEGFTLDYSRTKTFRRVATREFIKILEKYGEYNGTIGDLIELIQPS